MGCINKFALIWVSLRCVVATSWQSENRKCVSEPNVWSQRNPNYVTDLKRETAPWLQPTIIFRINRLIAWSRKRFVCPQPKNSQFTLTEVQRNQKIFTFKKLKSENSDFFFFKKIHSNGDLIVYLIVDNQSINRCSSTHPVLFCFKLNLLCLGRKGPGLLSAFKITTWWRWWNQPTWSSLHDPTFIHI